MGVKIPISTKEAQVALKQLRKDLRNVGLSATDTKKGAEKLENRLKKKLGAEKAKQATDRLTRSLKLTKTQLLAVKLRAGDVNGAMAIMGGRVRSVTKSMMGLKSAMVIMMGAAVFGMIIRKGAKFEQTMAGVKGVTEATAEEFKALTGIAKKLGETTEFTATQAAEGLKFLTMAGFDVNKAIAALPGVLDLATAGQLELGEAADITTNALTAMRLEVDQLEMVNDTFAKTITTSNTDIRMLAESFKYSAPLAAGLGYDIQKLSSWIGLLGNAGIQASMAGTQLNAGFQRLPKVFQKYGVSVRRADGSTKDLIDAVELLEKHGATAEEVLKLFAARGGRAMLAFLGIGSTQMREYLEIVKASEGASKRLAETMRNTTIGAFKELMSAIEGVQLSTFESQTGDLNIILKELTTTIRDNKDEIVAFLNGLARLTYGVGKGFTTLASGFGKLFKASNIDFPTTGIEVMEEKLVEAKEEAKNFEEQLRSSGRVTEEQIESALKPYNAEILKLAMLLAKARIVFKPHIEDLETTKDITAELAKVTKGLREEEEKRIDNLVKMYSIKSMASSIVGGIRTESDIQALDRQIKEFDELQKNLHKDAIPWEANEKKKAALLKKYMKERETIHNISLKDRIEADEAAIKGIAEYEKEIRQETVNEYEEIYNNFLGNVQNNFADTFYNIFSGQLDSFQDFADSMKDMFFRMLAEMAAKAAMTNLSSSLGGLSPSLGGTGGQAGGGLLAGTALGGVMPYVGAALLGFSVGQMIGSLLGLGKEDKERYTFSKDWQARATWTGSEYEATSKIKHKGKGKEITEAIDDLYAGYVAQANMLSNIVGGQGEIVFKPADYRFNFKNAEQKLGELAEKWSNTLWSAFDDAFERMGFSSMEAVIRGINREQDALGNAFQGALESGSWLLFKSNIAEQIYNTISEDLTTKLIQSSAVQGALMPVYGQIQAAMEAASVGGGFDAGLFRQGISGLDTQLLASFSNLKPAFDEIASLGQMIREMFVGAFQSGGVVPQTGLAMVHEGETISPEGIQSLSVVVQGNVIGTDLTNIIVEALENANNFRVGRPLQRFDLQTAGINVS